MLLMVLRRLSVAIPTIIGASLVIFVLVEVLPGDPLAGLLPTNATPAQRLALKKALGYDDPLPVRYLHWLGNVSHGNFGYSPYRRKEVSEVLRDAYFNTLRLTIVAGVFGLSLGMLFGTVAAVKRGTWVDRTISTVAVAGISVPAYWLAIVLIIIFSVKLRWLPASGMATPNSGGFVDAIRHLIMPAVATSLITIGITSRVTRASLIKTYGDDFVATLRAKGLSGWQILLHAAKNAALPVMTVAGLQVGFLVSSSVLTETIFSWPGIGQATFQAISARDMNMIEGAVILIALTFIVANLSVDILQGVLDPRMRRAT